MDRYNLENSTAYKGFTQEVLAFLTAQHWRGNIRELRNMVAKILVFAENQLVTYADLPDDLLKTRIMEPVSEFQGTMGQIEKAVIEKTMALTGGNVRRVSSILDIPLRTLYRKLKTLGSRNEKTDRPSQTPGKPELTLSTLVRKLRNCCRAASLRQPHRPGGGCQCRPAAWRADCTAAGGCRNSVCEGACPVR
jgi:hypothetical protein